MRDWNAPDHEPIVLVEGEGAVLRDDRGREYLDGNSSIWTNLHGHRRPEIDQAIRDQLDRLAHSSFLGLTNDVAPALAAELVDAAGLPDHKVFFSDDGSTAMEAALKMVFQARVQRGEPERTLFISLGDGYHGDTVGAMSAGHSALFHRAYRPLLFETREVLSPACYRCPYNQARSRCAVRMRARRGRVDWECVGELEMALDDPRRRLGLRAGTARAGRRRDEHAPGRVTSKRRPRFAASERRLAGAGRGHDRLRPHRDRCSRTSVKARSGPIWSRWPRA